MITVHTERGERMRLIDADLLKGQMESVCMGIMAGTDSYGAPLKTIDNAPTVDPVKHGHWTDNGHIGKRRWCSECGGIAFEQYDDYGLAEVTESDYCPHCGAKMDEVETK